MQFNIITIFPSIFDSYFSESIIKRAQDRGKIKIKIHDLRDYTSDKHKTVDDRPYGGGPGMIMKVEPVYKALDKNIKTLKHKNIKPKVILFTPTGKKFNQKTARRFVKYDALTMICPRYEGHDARIERLVDEKISIGDYVLTGGEIPAMVVVDAVSRLLPGVLGKDESSKDESFSQESYLEYPHYTRPEVFKGTRVPKILLSGNHEKIQEWREKHSKTRIQKLNNK